MDGEEKKVPAEPTPPVETPEVKAE